MMAELFFLYIRSLLRFANFSSLHSSVYHGVAVRSTMSFSSSGAWRSKISLRGHIVELHRQLLQCHPSGLSQNCMQRCLLSVPRGLCRLVFCSLVSFSLICHVFLGFLRVTMEWSDMDGG